MTIDWAPDGRSVLVGTTTPRLRVDNGMRAFKYDGTLLGKVAYDVLLDVQFVPAAPGVYEDRPQSPGTQKPQVHSLVYALMCTRIASYCHTTPAMPQGPAAAVVPSAAASGSGYIPPHMRGKAGAAQRAAGNFSLARDPNDQARAVAAIAAARQPPGGRCAADAIVDTR